MKNCIFLMGPTASGKTQLAIKLVQVLPLEIISVDSAMIYRGMDIGTAKPSLIELQQAPHHLIDILDPHEHYSAGRFVQDAQRLIAEIYQRKKIPLFVGGTMLYFNALKNGIASLPERDAKVRAAIESEAQIHGWPYLHQKLQQLDPAAAAKIKPTDKQRIERALEVYYLVQEPLSKLQSATRKEDLNILALAIAPLDRKILHARILKRCKRMLEQGFIDEVKALKARGDLSLKLASIRAVGYRQIWEYLDQAEATMSTTELLERIVIATRQYAKRQLTWLRAFSDIVWFDSEANDLDEQVKITIQRFLHFI
jgi:tRNA dimethylallyltransferase